MADAKKCDACGKLYILNTDKDLDERPVFSNKADTAYQRYLAFVSLFNNKGDNTGIRDLCPSCSHKIADVFSETDIFKKDHPSVEEPPIEETEDNGEGPNV